MTEEVTEQDDAWIVNNLHLHTIGLLALDSRRVFSKPEIKMQSPAPFEVLGSTRSIFVIKRT
jgi:hypothetical protein